MTVRLCQRARASCAACCGLYNRRDPGRAAVRAELIRHTRALARTERTPEAFRASAARLAADGPAPLFPSIRVCPLVGFLDAGETRVGCLAHPKATGGIDLRACGAYDVDTCESFLCPGHALLTEREAAVVEAASDYHLYGLVASDGPFVRAVIAALEGALGASVEPGDARHPTVASALRRLLAMKEELAPGSEGIFAAFHRGDPTAPEAARAPSTPNDRRAELLERLGADARSGNDLDRLEEELDRRLDGAIQAVAAFRGPRK